MASEFKNVANTDEALDATAEMRRALDTQLLDLKERTEWQKAVNVTEMATPEMAVQFTAIDHLWKTTLQPWMIEMSAAIERVSMQIIPALENIRPALEPLQSFYVELTQAEAQRNRMDDAGWLPHYTTPFEKIREAANSEIDSLLERHYTENWTTIKLAFIDHLNGYHLDDEAKATFRETLQAHETGLYRTVPRTLFPEIERVARLELHNGKIAPITSQQRLIEIAGNLLPSDIEPYGHFGLTLYSKLSDHIYAQCHATKLPTISKCPIPNRHAAMHGHAPYSKLKNSVNALIITDFIFQIIHVAKRSMGSE